MLTIILVVMYMYYYLYTLLLITDISMVLIYTFKGYFYPHHVKIAISSMYNF